MHRLILHIAIFHKFYIFRHLFYHKINLNKLKTMIFIYLPCLVPWYWFGMWHVFCVFLLFFPIQQLHVCCRLEVILILLCELYVSCVCVYRFRMSSKFLNGSYVQASSSFQFQYVLSRNNNERKNSNLTSTNMKK